MTLRQLANTDLHISPIGLGCWPIAGMTSLHVNDADSVATIQAAVDQGLNFLDTAYAYGSEGESERLIARAVGNRRDQVVIATKGGIHWDSAGQRVLDARPETLKRQCETSLRRLATDRVDLLYLHAPDPTVAVEESATALRRLVEAGKTRYVGVSNLTVEQMDRFQRECPIVAVQPPYNMLQRQIEKDVLPWCQQHHVAAVVYWPLMKGLLAGKLPRDHVFDDADGRAKYPMFQGQEWQLNQDFLDRLRTIAAARQVTVAQLVVAWTIQQPGITCALCGAKRPDQILETAAALKITLTGDENRQIAAALAARGVPIVRNAV